MDKEAYYTDQKCSGFMAFVFSMYRTLDIAMYFPILSTCDPDSRKFNRWIRSAFISLRYTLADYIRSRFHVFLKTRNGVAERYVSSLEQSTSAYIANMRLRHEVARNHELYKPGGVEHLKLIQKYQQ